MGLQQASCLQFSVVEAPAHYQVGAFNVSTYGRFDIIAKVHDYTICSSHITCICVQQEQGIRVPLYVVKAQPIPMVSDMQEFTLKKWRLYDCFLLKSATFVAVTIKVIANEVEV